MTWFEKVRKIVPTDKNTLGFVVVNGAQTAQALKDIKNATYKPTGLKEVLRTIQNKQLNPEKFLEMYEGSPHLDQTLEQIIENIEKIKNSVGFLTLSEVKELLDKALALKAGTGQGNAQRIKQILENIDQNSDLSRRTLERHRDIRDKLDILRMSSGDSVMMFRNPPENKKVLEDFAKLIGGTVIGESIKVPFKTEGQFIATMAYKRKKSKDAQGNEIYIITDTPAEKAKKDEIKEFYNDHFRKSGWSLNVGDQHIELDDIVTQKKLFVSSNVKYTVVEPFSASSVMKYIVAVDSIPGSVRAFKPRVFENGEPVPLSLFLDKSSPNSMNLNPYARIIMQSSFGDSDTWFKSFFDTLRATELLSEEDAEAAIINDIYESLLLELKTSKEGISLTSFYGDTGIEDLKTKTKGAVIKEIKKILATNARLTSSVKNKTYDKQNEQLQYLKEGAFTTREAIEFEKYWEEQGFDPEELKIEYFKDGRATARKDGRFQGFETDKDGEYLRDSAGQLIPLTDDEGKPLTEADEGKSEANYAKVSYFDDEEDKFVPTNPSDAYQLGLKVQTKPASATTQQKTSKTIEDIENKLKNVRLSNAQLPKTQQKNSKGKMINYPLMREQNDSIIANLERDLAEAKARKESPSQEKDLSADVGKLRDELLVVDDFPSYLKNMALKLKDEGGLVAYVNTLDMGASALNVFDPKRSLNFISQADELAGNEEVREAFKLIDENPQDDSEGSPANQLNEKMPKILQNIQESLVWSFKQRLEEFCKNPAKFPNTQVLSAIKQFTAQALIENNAGE